MANSFEADNAFWVELDMRTREHPDKWVRTTGHATQALAFEAARKAFLPSRITWRGRILQRAESSR